ncbi:MAG: DMT family transporter [Burkholderiales bacterium]|nr:DMT family transporter [Burkholderiales bacterium]
MLESALWAFAAAVCLSVAMITTRQGLRFASPAAGAAIGVPSSTLLFWCLAPFMLDLGGFDLAAVGVFALVGLFFPAAVTLLTYTGNQRMGPTITAAVSCTTPLFALSGAVLFLGEGLTPGNVLGTGAIVLGMLALAGRSGTLKRDWPLWAIGLPFAAAALRALAQVLTKAGLALWSNPYAATLIGYTVSAMVILAALRLRGPREQTDRRATPWFVATGILNGASLFLMYTALAKGKVALVSPIVATYPLITLALSMFILRQERMNKRVALGAMLTVAGVAVLLSF